MLTKKYFRQVAEKLSELPEEAQEESIKMQIDLLRGTNPRFDADRFRAYIRRRNLEKSMFHQGISDGNLIKKMIKKQMGYLPH
jgi:hypothetical protein